MSGNQNNPSIKEYFEYSDGAGIDYDNFINPETGTGFDSGTDIIVIPEPVNYNPPEIEIPEIEIPEIEIPEIEDIIEDIILSPDFNISIPIAEENILDLENLNFDGEYYLEQNPDIAAAGVDVISHFSQFGRAEDREYRYVLKEDYTPTPNINLEVAKDIGFQDISGMGTGTDSPGLNDLYFDRNYYLEQNPDLTAAGVDAISHFAQFGRLEDREYRYVFFEDLFDPEYYLEQNPDVAAAGVDPYNHYISFGKAEGRSPNAEDNLLSVQTIEPRNLIDLEPSDDFV